MRPALYIAACALAAACLVGLAGCERAAAEPVELLLSDIEHGAAAVLTISLDDPCADRREVVRELVFDEVKRVAAEAGVPPAMTISVEGCGEWTWDEDTFPTHDVLCPEGPAVVRWTQPMGPCATLTATGAP